MTTGLTSTYGRWGIVAGGSDGVGVAFAHGMAARGMNIVLVARRVPVLEAAADDIRARHGVEVRTVALDLSAPDAMAKLAASAAGLEVGLFVYNAGGDDRSTAFLDKDLEAHRELVNRNCVSVLEAAYRFGAPMVARGRGGLVLVTSGAAWAGGATLAAYGATKAFDLILAEALWAEWRGSGVDAGPGESLLKPEEFPFPWPPTADRSRRCAGRSASGSHPARGARRPARSAFP